MSIRIFAACSKTLIGPASLKMFVALSPSVLFVNKKNMTPRSWQVSSRPCLFLQPFGKMFLWTSSPGYHRLTTLPLFWLSWTNFQKKPISGHYRHTIPLIRLPSYFLTVCKHHGFPQTLVSDRDPLFIRKFWRSFFASVEPSFR